MGAGVAARPGGAGAQQIANLVAITSVPFLTIEQRQRAAVRAFDRLEVPEP